MNHGVAGDWIAAEVDVGDARARLRPAAATSRDQSPQIDLLFVLVGGGPVEAAGRWVVHVHVVHEAALVERAGCRGQVVVKVVVWILLGTACWLSAAALLILFVLHFLI